MQRLRVSREWLGSMLSLSGQTVNALLQGLERERLVVCVRGGVRILDARRLLELDASIQQASASSARQSWENQ